MNQPFNKKQIRSYLLFYGGVILLVLLFYVTTTLFHTPATHAHRLFPAERNATEAAPVPMPAEPPAEPKERPFRLLPAR